MPSDFVFYSPFSTATQCALLGLILRSPGSEWRSSLTCLFTKASTWCSHFPLGADYMQITLHPHARESGCLNPHQFSWPFQLYCEVYFKFQIFDPFLDRIVTLILIKSEILAREHSLFRSVYNYCLMNLCVYTHACHWCACVYVGGHIWHCRGQCQLPSCSPIGLHWLADEFQGPACSFFLSEGITNTWPHARAFTPVLRIRTR